MDTGLEEKVLECIRAGSRTSPIQSSWIEARFSIPGTQVRDIVRNLRRQGIPICVTSDRRNRKGGYYYSEDSRDVAEMLEDLTRRIKSMEKTLRMFREGYKKDMQLKF